MKLNQLSGDVHLTYCTNIHAGQSWQDIRASLDEHVPAIKSTVAPSQPMGIGLRLSGEAAAVARQPEALASFRDQLSMLGAYVFTINAFPFGPFHGVRVKEDYVRAPFKDQESYPPEEVKKGYYYVLGDHRNSSNDSRNWGEVPEKYIYGKAFFRFWPVSKIGFIQ